MLNWTLPESVLGITPFGEPNARLVAALCAAGALGVLDLGAGDRRAREELERATGWISGGFGVRFGAACAMDSAALPAGVTTAVYDGRLVATGEVAVAAARGGLRILVEVTGLAEAEAAVAAGADGLIARGNEAGGRVGDLSSLVLVQQLLAEVDSPVWVCGGVGEHTAPAAAVAGAAGVVLDSQLALLAESGLPHEVAAAIRTMDGSETVVVDGYRVLRSRTRSGDVGGAGVAERLGARDLRTQLLPIGQDGFLAGEFARRYGNAAGAVRAVRGALVDLARADVTDVLGPGAPLARRLGIGVPVVQGPMTRVSDRPEFAAAVADAAGLPMMALALSDADTTTALLESTAKRLAGRPWGVGILGFAPEDIRSAQLAAIRRVRPDVVVIAGGRPGQAAELEELGIAAFVHVPSPRLLGQFLDAGARRFVFEGSECGGHIGPRSSMCLWQAQISALVDFLDTTPGSQVDVLFAGGVHDARSAAMVAAVAAPLTARGAGVGLLMGTAYLFTEEAVATGAIGPVFQRQVLAARATAVLQTAPGHSTRCVDSPFAAEFAAVRQALVEQGLPQQQVWERLELLNVGRSRVASKGLRRDGELLVGVDPEGQLASGLFMAGQVASLRSRRTTVAELHAEVTTDASRLLADAVGRLRGRLLPTTAPATAPPPLDIAIIGMSCVFPGAPDMAAFWANVLGGVDSVTEVPADRWDPAVHYSADAAEERVISKWGGFLDPVPFDALRYGIAPASLASIEPVQLLALEVAQRALADAGFAEHPAVTGHAVRDFDRSRTAVVFGAESGGELSNAAMLRAMLPGYLRDVPAELTAQLPRFTEDTFPGVLANVISGRIANRLDLGGANFTVDAACASSLAALDVACRELVGGTADLVLCGGADTHNGIYDYRLFDSVGALSPTGRSRTFDRSADGIALSEGVGCVVLKRLDDAVRDGDRVYAVIKGVGSSSDGRSLGLTAPRPAGQRQALTRAFANAGVSPAEVGLVEAHGTGTAVGDRTELASLEAVFTEAGARPGGTVLGSVKSQIGHTKCAAGLAGLIKTALAIHTGVRPPTAQLTSPIGEWSARRSPFAFNTEARPWAAPPARRFAGISGFGFGGTNFHAVLAGRHSPAPRHGHDQWPAELFLLHGDDVRWLRELVADRPDARLRDLALTAAHRFDRVRGQAAFAVVAADTAALTAALDAADGGGDAPGLRVGGPPGTPSKIAVLFPGQGSQRVGMTADLLVAFPELREQLLSGHRWADEVYPGAAFDDGQAGSQREALRDTRVAQPALGMAGLAGYGFLERAGLRVDMVAGHSYGELVALAAAGALAPADLFEVSVARAESILAAAGDDPGAMAAVAASADQVEQVLGDQTPVVIANHNSPSQVVLSGPTAAVADAVDRLRAAGLSASPLPVACAFHSPVVAGAAEEFALVLGEHPFHAPEIPVWSNRTAARYPGDPAAIRAELAAQIGAPVRFAEQVEAMYADGARTFVECGPGTVLSGLVAATLRDRPHRVVGFESAGGGLPGALAALAELAVGGADLRLARLFHGRDARDLTGTTAPAAPRWLVDGAAVRTADGRFLPGAASPARRIAPVVAATDPDQVIGDYLRGTRELVAAQREIMLAYYQADTAPRQVLPPAPPLETPVVVEQVVAAVVPAAVPSAASTLEVVTSTISERTGYPADMIEPGLDLEADLSIDSIKRTEIVGELAARVGTADDRLGDTEIEALARIRTAGGLAEWLDRRLGTAPQAVPAASPPVAEIPSGAPPTRFVLSPVPAHATPRNPGHLAGRTFVVSGGSGAVGTALRDLLAAHGATVVDDLPEDDAAAGLVHLDALSPDPGDVTVHVPAFRAVARVGLVVAVAPSAGFPVPGMRGFLRSLAKEYPTTAVRLVEVDTSRPAEETAGLVLGELLTPRDHPVVRSTGERSAFAMTRSDLGVLGGRGAGPGGQGEAEAAAIGLDRDSVLLLIGGARGITARFALTAAAASGCRIVVAGRTPAEAEARPPAVAAATDLAGVRAALFSLGDRDHTAVDLAARRVMAGRQVATTLARLRSLGGEVEYCSVDVTDEQSVRNLLKRVHSDYGRLDGVIFSPGVIEDRLFADKTAESFRRVFATKVMGARALLSAVDDLPQAPGFVVLFGSIAAVLGNRGQTDYAAGNDAMEVIAEQWARRTGNRALTVHWGPWAPDAELGGMVTAELAAEYARRGIGLIAPQDGAMSLLRELAWGDPTARSVVYTASGW
ncbi:SDR family NAD(P)-dependent oxidoreductase [Umezawaea sp. Da 62-37]|uniref:SDR family NAD(P)-dependent oxidoreductase n=1 Tax=Umezawaea sp. Da 62-37 TaxID=3075927 RepID=UPI0028F74C9E|nr:SDR family NAD(P)-dependent oxidoreductase [Umezawaea sp. Da 62-37]WNV86240.1 SDR family NAD(P)-dependent oxidoreductase [Umezawaea sp. Da 62-37]